MVSLQVLVVCFVGLAALQPVFTAPTASIADNNVSANSVNPPPSDRDALAPVYGKSFIMESCDNMDGALEAAGINENIRKTLIESFTFSLKLTRNGENYELSSDIYVKIGNIPVKLLTSTVPFRLGQEIQVLNVNGEIVTAVITQDGNKLTETRHGAMPGTTVRIFTPEEVKTIVKIKGSTNNCIYKPERSQSDQSNVKPFEN